MGHHQGQPTYSPEVPQLDNRVDQLLTSIRDVADAYQEGALEGSPQQAAAERFVSVAFPLGVQAITSLPYLDRVAAVESMLRTVTTEASDELTAEAGSARATSSRPASVSYLCRARLGMRDCVAPGLGQLSMPRPARHARLRRARPRSC